VIYWTASGAAVILVVIGVQAAARTVTNKLDCPLLGVGR
jgi:hypothetical protein